VASVIHTETIADRAAGYGIPGVRVDGNDVLIVYEAAQQALARARNGDGPTLLELVTYRITGHSRRDPALYQPEEEKKRALENEPIGRFARYLLEQGVADQAALDAVGREADEQIEAAVEAAVNAADPEPEDALDDMFVEQP
jgi:TPP-dependent pyruvate/acetoin dehydrogenase alpha subunit